MIESDIAFVERLPTLRRLRPNPLPILGTAPKASTSITRTTEDRTYEAEAFRLRGDLLNGTGDQPAAEESYQRALAVSRRQSAKTFELRVAMSLAQLWRDQDKRKEASDLLAPVYAWFTEGFDTPILQGAKTLLDKLKQ